LQTGPFRVRHSIFTFVVVASSVLFLPILSFLWAEQEQQRARVFCVADVHGDFDDFVAILQKAGVINADHHWIAHDATLVQLGDILDRGPKPREAMDLLMSLEKEASASGGRVVSLLGNHEVMNIMGDLRYVTPVNFASFADNNSSKRQRNAYDEYVKWRKSHAALIAELVQPMELTETEWMARHPEGFVEQREAFGPHGEYGKWLRSHSAITKIGMSIFLHGGIATSLAGMKLDDINSRIRDEIKTFDAAKQYFQDKGLILSFFNLQELTAVLQAELMAQRKSRVPGSEKDQTRIGEFLEFGNWLSVRPDSPLWFRGYDQWSEEEGVAQIDKILRGYGAAHVVIGHTVQKGGRIRSRFADKVFLIDTGMLSSYYPGGRASVLEIYDGAKFTADYMDQQVLLLEPAHSTAP
jgi:Calcineurin-like phosphoesterase